MLIHPDVETAIRLCLRHNRPFVAYSAPGSSTLHFHSSGATVECPGNRHFIISSFNSPVSEMLHIPLTHNAAETISLLADIIPSQPTYPSPLPQKPTTHSSYTAGLARVISHLRTHGGKCVISRAICGQYTDEADWIGFAKEYFNTFPHTADRDMDCGLPGTAVTLRQHLNALVNRLPCRNPHCRKQTAMG